MKPFYTTLLLISLLFYSNSSKAQCASCDAGVTTYVVDLSSASDTVWSISSTRNGYCCGATGSTNCVRFEVTVNPNTTEIGFDVKNPAPSGGAFYQVDCGTPTSLGTPLCVTGTTSFCITFCKSGGDSPTYTISASQSFAASPDIAINSNCITDISVTGLDESTIQWNSVAPGNSGDFNNYLSCLSACDTTTVTPQPGYPTYIDFEVTGTPVGCAAGTSRDTVRVYINDGIIATINPNPAFVCSGSSNAVVTASGTGGAPPYSYNWSTGETTQSISVGAGTFWVEISDTSANCPASADTVIVTTSGGPITASAGADQIVCSSSPAVTLAGAITEAVGGVWTGGTGTFAPNDSTLNATYTPSAAEILAGTLTLTLTSYGNGGCTGATDNMLITIQQAPVVAAGNDIAICQGDVASLTGTVTGGAGTGIWSTSGTGTFSPSATDLNASYSPSATDISSGTVTLTLSATAACAATSDQLILTISPPITVTAGTDQIICQGDNVSLTGSVTGGTTTGSWSSSGTGTFSPSATTLNATYTPSATDISNGSVTLTLTSTNNGGCNAVSDNLIVSIQQSPVVAAGNDIAICEGATISLGGSITGGAGTGIWTTSGSGTFSPSDTDLNATYNPSAADIISGTVTITLTATNTCSPVNDQLILSITSAIIVNAGIDQIICQGDNVTLTGSVTGGSTTGTWTSSGTGTFSPSATTLNATYTPSATDISNGSVTLTLTSTNNGNCAASTDNMIVTITLVPVVAAGNDQAVCESDVISLAGSVTIGSTTGIWTASGTGTFSPSDTDLNATYNPSATDVTNGSVTLTLTSTGGCQNVTDQLVISITPLPVVNAGNDQTVCANNANTNLSGSITIGGAAGIWTSSGTGTFSPSDTDLNAIYTPSNADTASGSVTITLTSTDGCGTASDNLVLTITPAPIVNAGSDITLCANNITQLNGSISGPTTTGIWTSSGTGTFSPSDTDLNAIYTPSAADTTSGSVTLTLTSTNNGNCAIVTDQLLITFSPAPIVNAGIDQTVCENNNLVSLSGSVTGGATTGIWTTSGNGTFTSNTDLNAQYTPGVNDILLGNATLTLTSTNNGGCIPVSNQIVITITPAPVVNAGTDQTVCQNAPDVTLNGSVTGGTTTGQWISNGTGTFNPSDTDMNAVYSPSATDISNGNVVIALQSTGNGNCLIVSDTISITITTAPVVDAGSDVTMCANNVINLNGIITGFTTTGVWTTTGSGTFSPSASDLGATYIPSSADTTSGSVTITLTSTNNSSCIPVTDDMIITFTPAPIVNAGIDQTVCSNNAIANLNGSISGGSTTGIWNTTGSGTFSLNTDLMASYSLSPSDTTNGSVTLILTSTNNGTCLIIEDSVLLSVISPPNVDAGTSQFICLGDNATLSGVITNGAGTGIWTSSGTGAFLPSDTDLNPTYTPSAADEASGSVNIFLTSTNNGNCLAVEDTLILTFVTQPTVTAGTDITICSSDTAQLSGTVSGSSTTGQWTSSGDGIFIPSDTDLNANYIPGPNDITNGNVIINLESTNSCYNSDQVIITITQGPTVNAGADQIICVIDTQVNLSGVVGGITTTGQWTSSGTGSFSPSDTDLNTIYNLTSIDSTAGQFNLILTSTGNGVCSAVSDTLLVTMTTIPVVNAGNDTTFCANNMGILNGSVTGGASSGIWTTSGTGSFSPSDIDLNAIYYPSDADTTAGSVTLTLTSTGACIDISDNVLINVTPGPIAIAGNDTTICNSADLQLSGIVYGATFTGQWTTSGDGTFSPSETDINAIYTPGSNDLSNGNFELYLSPTNIGNCLPVEDTMVVSILSPPTANAGEDQVICSGNSVAISGTISGGSGGQWSTLGSGTFSGSGLSLDYSPSSADTASGSTQLVLSTDPSGLCGQDSDTLTLFFVDQPYVYAGIDLSVCANNDTVAISGTTTNGEGVWFTSGDGIFITGDSILNTSYLPGINDVSTGSVELYLNSLNTQGCPETSDTLLVNITPAPIVNAGQDISTCLNNLLVSLSGSITGGSTSGYWWTDGTGTFIPDSLSLGTNYQPSIADTTTGVIHFALTSSNNGSCFSESDTLLVTFDSAPEIMLDSSYTTCQSDTVTLAAIINGGGTVTWSTSGSGTFIDSLTNPVQYIPSAADTLGTIEMYAAYTNGCGTVSDTLLLNVLPSPGLNISFVVNCETFEVSFDAQTNTGTIESIVWDFGDGTTDSIANPVHPYSSDGTYTVDVFTSTFDGCTDNSNFIVSIVPLPVANFIVSDSVLTPGEVIVFNDTSQNAISWEWNFGDGSTSYFVEDTSYAYLNEGNYTVTLTVTNAAGCTASSLIIIEINGNQEVFPPAIPNAFTPNGDTKNDILYVRGGPFNSFEFKIFNEWGNEIFSSDAQSIGWNGYYKGKLQPVGVYIYTFTGITEDGTEYSLSGDFSIIR